MNPEQMLAEYRKTHTFKQGCKWCHSGGHTGKYLTGPEKGLYIPCRCAKKKPKVMIEDSP